MAIILRLDRMMADRKISLTELSERVGISMANLSNLKTGKVKAIRFSTLDAICRELHCQPGDILDASQWEEKAKDLAGRFIKNFKKYEGNEHGKALVSAGPQL